MRAHANVHARRRGRALRFLPSELQDSTDQTHQMVLAYRHACARPDGCVPRHHI
jgi:hypothetical protein